MVDLSLVTTEDLVNEFISRHHTALLVFADPKDFLQLVYSGRITGAMGLAAYADKRLYSILTEKNDETSES